MVGIIIQARTSSTRLPRKVLKDLPYGSGISVLQNVIRRASKSEKADIVVVATTTESVDDVIEDIAISEGVEVYRGEKEDLLKRWLGCADKYGINTIVRITSDNPCIFHSFIDKAIDFHKLENNDYTTTDLPLGLNFDVMERKSLRKIVESIDEKTRIDRRVFLFYDFEDKFNFRVGKVRGLEDYGSLSDARLTLDTVEDYALLCAVFDYLGTEFTFKDLKELFMRKPWLKFINIRVAQKKLCSTLEEEIEEAKKVLKLQELNRVADLLESLDTWQRS